MAGHIGPSDQIVAYNEVVKALASRYTSFPGWEDHLVARAKVGEPVAFELLIDLHRSSVVSHAMRMLRDSDDAQDAAQDTFVKACRALGTFESGRPMLPWLLRICSNCCVDIIRARRASHDSLESHEHALFDKSVNVEEGVASAMGLAEVSNAIDRLPPRYREILVLRHFEHMDVLAIAERLHKPEGTIKSWLFRARKLLCKDLQFALET